MKKTFSNFFLMYCRGSDLSGPQACDCSVQLDPSPTMSCQKCDINVNKSKSSSLFFVFFKLLLNFIP